MELFELNEKQRKAFLKFKAAHKECLKSGIKFYNNYGTIGAMDSSKLSHYDDNKNGISNDGQNWENEFKLECNEWADDHHYFHPA